MKRILTILFLSLIIVFTLSACEVIDGSGTTQNLEIPGNLKIEDSVLTWDDAENAGSYLLNVNGSEKTSEINSFSLDGLEDSSYSIMVKSVGNPEFNDSDWSEIITFDKFTAPQDLTVTENYELTWTPSAEASGYIVSVYDSDNGLIKDADLNNTADNQLITFDISDLASGYYNFAVRAYGNSAHNLSAAGTLEYTQPALTYFIQDSENSASTVHLRVIFKLREDFTFNDYNFSLTGENAAEEYNKIYNDIFNGTQSEKEEAITKIGNDIIIRYHHSGNVLTTKTKAWDGYLNRFDASTPNNIEKLSGYYFGTTLDSGYNYITAYNITNSSLINSLRDEDIFIDIAVIKDGVLFINTVSYQVH